MESKKKKNKSNRAGWGDVFVSLRSCRNLIQTHTHMHGPVLDQFALCSVEARGVTHTLAPQQSFSFSFLTSDTEDTNVSRLRTISANRVLTALLVAELWRRTGYSFAYSQIWSPQSVTSFISCYLNVAPLFCLVILYKRYKHRLGEHWCCCATVHFTPLILEPWHAISKIAHRDSRISVKEASGWTVAVNKITKRRNNE